jgi:hypothetical protein
MEKKCAFYESAYRETISQKGWYQADHERKKALWLREKRLPEDHIKHQRAEIKDRMAIIAGHADPGDQGPANQDTASGEVPQVGYQLVRR